MADVHAKRGKFREAEKLYKDVLEIAPTPATPRKQILRTRRGKATVVTFEGRKDAEEC